MAVTSIKIALVICGLATFVAANDEDIMKITITKFHGKDLNQDGVLSSEELNDEFEKYDANNDGIMTMLEMTDIPNDEDVPDHLKKMFSFYDAFDGKVDGLIQRSAIPEYIRTLDANGDGVLGLEESLAPLKKALEDTCEVSQEVPNCKGIP